MPLIEGEVLNTAIGLITGLFGGSPARLNQIEQREQDAKDNGFPDWKSWDAKGSPWNALGTLTHYLRLGLPVTPAMYIAAGYKPPGDGGVQIRVPALESGQGNTSPELVTNPLVGLTREDGTIEKATVKETASKLWAKPWVKYTGIGVLLLLIGFIIYKFAGKKKVSYGRR